ncbi:hypothetical protein SAY86_012167 [Trapa natans]|uniref:Uncharacterized protein n=1 Tax=Trapa natans TaxID=22666 RepID=A0AAN7LRP9_TRANT|nr:hypothetical protein SAY86_012167 [Trapa natans]
MAPETDWNCGGVGDIGGGSRSHWWWALGGAAQIGWGISSFLRGCAGDSRLMPFKAFSVASLFVGGAASASFAALQASGIRKVEDLMEVGANIRRSLGVRPRARANGAGTLLKLSDHFMAQYHNISTKNGVRLFFTRAPTAATTSPHPATSAVLSSYSNPETLQAYNIKKAPGEAKQREQ